MALRFLLKNKAIGDSKSVQEVFGQDEEAQITVMVMKNVTSSSTTTTTTPTTTSSSRGGGGENMEIIDNDAFWEEIKNVVMEKYVGKANKEDVYASLRKGYEDKFKTG